MKIEEIKKLFVNNNDVIRFKSLRKGDSYSINEQKISYRQVKILEKTYNTKEIYQSLLINVIKFIPEK